MQLTKRFLCTTGCLFGVLAIGVTVAPKLSAAVKAALVEIALPGKPFFGQAGLTVNNNRFGTGSDERTLGITNLVVTNFTNAVSTVEIYQPVLSPNAGSCFGPITGTGGP